MMNKISTYFTLLVMGISSALFAAPPVANIADIYLSEILPDPNGTEPDNEYLELRGPAGEAIPSGVYYIGIEGDIAGGVINEIIDLGGLVFGSNGGILLIANPSLWDDGDVPIAAGTTVNNSIFPGTGLENDTATYCLIQWDGTPATQPVVGNDVDVNNDNQLDDGTESGAAQDYDGTWTFIDGLCSVDSDATLNNDHCYGPFITFSQQSGFTNTSGVVVDTTSVNDETQIFGRIDLSTGDTAADWYTATVPNAAADNLADYVGLTFPGFGGGDGTIPASFIGLPMFSTVGGPDNIPLEVSAFELE